MSVLELLSQQLGGDAAAQVGKQLGVDPDTASRAIAGALPMLMGALAKNSSQPGGAEALAGALERDHDGSVLEDAVGFLGGSSTEGGSAILEHILGSRKENVAKGLGSISGLDGATASKLMAMLAPIVLGALGKQKKDQQLDAGGLAEMLRGEKRNVERNAPSAAGMLGQLLDADGDGEIGDDVAKLGMSVLGKLFSK